MCSAAFCCVYLSWRLLRSLALRCTHNFRCKFVFVAGRAAQSREREREKEWEKEIKCMDTILGVWCDVCARGAAKKNVKFCCDIYAQIKVWGRIDQLCELSHDSQYTQRMNEASQCKRWRIQPVLEVAEEEKEHTIFPIALVFHFFTVFFCVVDFPSLLLLHHHRDVF